MGGRPLDRHERVGRRHELALDDRRASWSTGKAPSFSCRSTSRSADSKQQAFGGRVCPETPCRSRSRAYRPHKPRPSHRTPRRSARAEPAARRLLRADVFVEPANGAHAHAIALLERDRLAHQHLALHMAAEAGSCRTSSAPPAAASRGRAAPPRADCLSRASPSARARTAACSRSARPRCTRTSAISRPSFTAPDSTRSFTNRASTGGNDTVCSPGFASSVAVATLANCSVGPPWKSRLRRPSAPTQRSGQHDRERFDPGRLALEERDDRFLRIRDLVTVQPTTTRSDRAARRRGAGR